MKYLVLGGGLQGKAVAYDLLNFDTGCEVIVGDIDENRLSDVRQLVGAFNISTVKVDIFDMESTINLISKVDFVINSLPHPWEYTESFYKACCKVKTKALLTDYWEWKRQYEFDEGLKRVGSLVVPGLGIVPGLGNICVGQLAYEFDQLEEAVIYCGGLPVERGATPFDYMVLFNVEALLDLYLTDPEVIEDGKTVVKKHLYDIETFFIPGYGQVDALKTDGLYSLNKTMKEKGVKRLSEATLRYPGHYQTMKLLEKYGFFAKEPIDINGIKVSPRDLAESVLNKTLKKIPGVRDFTYLLVKGKGLKAGKYVEKSYELLDYSDEEVGLTSMERTTAYPSSVAAIMLANEDFGMLGVVEPERIFIGKGFNKMVSELAKRNIILYEK